ncbi:hypothetical protein JAAARDRAFT_61692 [Jaapia argillacea MUCL 33604]|uniref:WDR59/RTC1-like RING zinc finger domain-containing protein n=1 Tax=Jaapia argillacea MUCL 33604 TaxID=933084 RepID=A0A067PNQ7_9AGAM|nr:hypothetical protein JAAARDRAFT_61692 [Jaapia argillacea MUCL 33604]
MSSNSDSEDVASTVVSRTPFAQRQRPPKTPRLSFDSAFPTDSRIHEPVTSPLDSPDDDTNIRRSLQIDMKDLVGDAVGNMSISPASRDVVLAARKGLFIIDLEAPFEVPRFLPQGGTWDVADVQWNPHPVRSEYIVSTSSEKLLIWNLLLSGKTSIQHVLHSHYRAITDINWHNSEPDIVASTGIDSWVWAWDLRDLRPEKPIFGLCAFNAGGTQVKWSRQDPNILASSHMTEVLIWDRRKGSLPITRVKAHNSKIYGIDWARERPNEIVTCSLDKTIKVWDLENKAFDGNIVEPKMTIHTRYPVWRARDLPFGRGLMSLPQRGETALEMYAHSNTQIPVEVFEGHTDVVKEFVWRRGGESGGEFQLITWSKDRTLRFWPVGPDVMQRVGHVPGSHSRPRVTGYLDNKASYRDPPARTDHLPALSAPVGYRSILAEVRASVPLLHPLFPPDQPTTHDSHITIREPESMMEKHFGSPPSKPIPILAPRAVGETMSRGHLGGRSARVDAFQWIASIKVEKRKGSSSGGRSGADSANVSRLSSRSRPLTRPESRVISDPQQRSGSRGRPEDGEGNRSLQDEITSVLTKLASYKIRLERHDLTKRRMCTLGLHGPWGESSLVFIRVTFTFPRDYPYAIHPNGTPTVDLERNPLISIKNRAFMLRRLRRIRERRPCLEACLRFLLLGKDEHVSDPPAINSGSSSEDESGHNKKQREPIVAIVRNNKNLAEPRTSQGVFGPNGELVCFFQAPPRILRTARDVSASPSVTSRHDDGMPRLFQSPAIVSDAVRRLSLAALDRSNASTPRGPDDTGNILRVMTNLLTAAQQKHVPESFSLLSVRLSTVYLRDTSHAGGPDRTAAERYGFLGESPSKICQKNADLANQMGRYDHERIFKLLETLLHGGRAGIHADSRDSTPSSLSRQFIDKLYVELSSDKDLQMLAMLSSVLLQAFHPLSAHPTPTHPVLLRDSTPANRKSGVDYFSVRRGRKDSRSLVTPISPIWNRPQPSPTISGAVASLSSSNSSRGSWSSLFNTGSVRQFMSGVPESSKENSNGAPEPIATSGFPIPVPGKSHHSSESPRRRGFRRDSSVNPLSPTPKSWTEPHFPPAKVVSSFSSVGHVRRPTFSQVVGPRAAILEKKVLAFDTDTLTTSKSAFLEPSFVEQLVNHVLVYAEMLFAWQLLPKRVELLKSVSVELRAIVPIGTSTQSRQELQLGVHRLCTICSSDLSEDRPNSCSTCGAKSTMPRCSICSLPIKGLSYNCLKCCHVVHATCHKNQKFSVCPSGCGCQCLGFQPHGHDRIGLVTSPVSMKAGPPL